MMLQFETIGGKLEGWTQTTTAVFSISRFRVVPIELVTVFAVNQMIDIVGVQYWNKIKRNENSRFKRVVLLIHFSGDNSIAR